MRKGYFFFFLLFVVSIGAKAQTLFDSFTDGDFTAAPVWGGNTTAWTIVANSDVAAGATGSNTLRLAVPTAVAGTEYLSSQISIWGTSQEWGFFVGRRAQAFTAANQMYIWLYANESDLTSATVDGYRLAIGDDAGGDEIRLEYIVNGALSSTVITSTGSFTNGLTDIGILIRVTRSSLGTWEIFTSTIPIANGNGAIATDIPNAANASISQGTGANNSLVPVTNDYIGVAAIHTTAASARAAVELDQVYFTPTVTTNTITIIGLSGTTFNLADCNATANGTVDFLSTGIFLAGNTYTVELSDALGSFASPVVIGSLPNDISNGGTIAFTIPAGALSGTQYKIRITSDNPTATSDLSADITINQSGSCISNTTDYFKSRTSGAWGATTTWDSSPDNISWHPATLVPTSTANTITILNTHTVTVLADANMDQVTINNGGILIHTAGVLTINDDASGDDVVVESGGRFTLNFINNAPVFSPPASATARIKTGGVLRVAAGGMSAAGVGVNSSNFIYEDASALEFSTAFSTIGVTYFPNVNATTIPIFRVLTNLVVGAGSATAFNGVFETDFPVSFQNSGTKTFRNGIRGTGTITALASSGQFIINGLTAELGGAGFLIVPPSGLQIGSAGGTTVTVTSDKSVTGDISLLSTNTFVDVATRNLTVSGNVTGGTATSYIKTPSTGSLILKTVDNITSRIFPVGHSSYNPVTIAMGSSHDWTVNVNDGVVADPPNGITGAVFRTWGITPSVNPPTTGATLTFQFDISTDVGSAFNTPPHDVEPVQVWHRKLGYWLAVGTTVPLVNVGGNIRTATVTGATQFSPYAISRMSLPLPIKLISFNVVKLSSSVANVTWELAACCSKDARFELEKSTDGINFSSTAAIAGSETNRFYTYLDTRLGKGTTYYRLKATDADGKKTYSRVIVIINDKQGLMITTMAPNPVSNAATVSIASAKAGMVQFAVTDLSGRIIKQWQAAVAEGNSTFSINTATLANGIYHLSATMEGIKTVIRFVKQ